MPICRVAGPLTGHATIRKVLRRANTRLRQTSDDRHAKTDPTEWKAKKRLAYKAYLDWDKAAKEALYRKKALCINRQGKDQDVYFLIST